MNPRTRPARAGLISTLFALLVGLGWSLPARTVPPAPAQAEPAAPLQDTPDPVAPSGRSPRQTWLPVIQDFGSESCIPKLVIQNLGDDPTKAVLITWAEAGDCMDQKGPEKIECGGLIAPGGSWDVATSQLSASARSGVIYSFTARTAGEVGIGGIDPGEVVADILCERLFFELPGDVGVFRDFKTAFDDGGSWEGIPMDRAWGGPLAVQLLRSCRSMATDGARGQIESSGIAGDRLKPSEIIDGGAGDEAGYHYRVPARVLPRSYLYLQNAGVGCQTLSVDFVATVDECPSMDQPGPGAPISCLESASLAAGERLTIDLKACAGDATLGALWIRSDGPLAIAQDVEAGGAAQAGHTETAERGRRLLAPYPFAITGPDWTLRAVVQNHGATAGTAKLYMLDRSGDVVTTLVHDLCPHGAAGFEFTEPVAIPLTGSWRIESLPKSVVPGELQPGPEISAFMEFESNTLPTQLLRYPFVADEDESDQRLDHAVIALPRLRKVTGEPISQVSIANTVGKPGYTDFITYIYDANALVDFVCQKLHAQQLESIDLESWGYVAPGFVGSAVVSATYWEHEVFDGQGNFLRNLVDLTAVHARRSGADVAESVDAAASTALRFPRGASPWSRLGLPICPAHPTFPPPVVTPTRATPSPSATPGGASPTPDGGVLSPIAAEPALRQVFAPLMRRSDAEDAEARLSVQSMGTEPSKVILVIFGPAADCGAASAGPLKVECSGLLSPGSSWTFGGPQLTQTHDSAVAFGISARSFAQLGIGSGRPGSDQSVADFLCERLFFDLPGDAAAYARFKQAFDEGGDYDGLPMDRVLGAPLSASLLRDHQASPEPRLDQQQAYGTPRGDELLPDSRSAGRWQYHLPLRASEGPSGLGVWLQNGGSGCASPSIEVRIPPVDDLGCNLPPSTCAIDLLDLAPGQSRRLDLTGCAGLSRQTFVLRVESDQPLAIAIEGQTGRSGMASAAGNLETGTRLQAPLPIPDPTPLQRVEVLVQNHDPARSAQVALYHQSSDGAVRSTDQARICPGGVAAFVLDHSHDPGGSLRVESQPQALPDGSSAPGPQLSAQIHIVHDPDGDWPGQMRYGMQASRIEVSHWVERGLLAVPLLTRSSDDAIAGSQIMVHNATAAAGFTELIYVVYDQNGLLDFRCERLDRGEVAPFDLLRDWGTLSPGFRGSAIISAVYWQHLIFDAQGEPVANPVELVATWADRGLHFENRSEFLVRPRAHLLDAFDADFAARFLPRLHDDMSLTCPGVPDVLPTRIPRPATPTVVGPMPTTATPTPSTITPTAGPTVSATAVRTASPTPIRPAAIYLPALLSRAEPWPTGFFLVVDTSPDEDSATALEDEAPRGQLEATRRIGERALDPLRAGTDLAGIIRYGSEGSAELYAMSQDPAEIATRLSDFQPDRLRATTRPDLALAVAVTAFREMPVRYAGRALLLFVDGRSQPIHLERAADRAATLRAGAVRVFVIASESLDEGDLLEAIAGQPGRLLRVDLDQEAEVQRVLATVDGWAARGWAGGAFPAPSVIQPLD